MSKKDDTQLDLFTWADSRPAAEVLDFKRFLARAILANPDRYDPMVTPRPNDTGHVLSLSVAIG